MTEEIMLPENLNKEGITDIEVQQIWFQRRSRMQERRRYFEPLWRSAITTFYAGIFPDTNAAGEKPIYNPIYEQYDMTVYSRDGFRFLRMKMPIVHEVIIRKLASEFSNRPKINWVAEGSNDPAKAIAFRHWYNQFLYDMDADQEDYEVFLGKDIVGTSAVMVQTDEYEVTIKDAITGKKETKKKKRSYYRNIDMRHLLLDEHCTKTNLEDCNYACVDEFLSRQEFLQHFADEKKFDPEKVKRASEISIQNDEAYGSYNDLFGLENVPFIRVSHCFDIISDSYDILANDIKINEIGTPIPRVARTMGKQIPIALCVDFKMPNCPYGYSSAHVIALFYRIKNLVRQLLFEVTEKQAKPLLAVDPLSGFDEETFEWGQEFIRIKPTDVQAIEVQFDTKALWDLDKTTDEDIIRSTGINYNDTSNIDANETARKTIIRRESQNAIIELGMNYNASVYFKRLYELYKDEILFHWRDMIEQGQKVRTKNAFVFRDQQGVLKEDGMKVEGFRYFDLQPGDIAKDYELYLETANIASSRELEKAILTEQLQAIAPFIQSFDANGIAGYIKDILKLPEEVLPSGAGADISKVPSDQLAQQGMSADFLPQSVQNQSLLQQPNAPLPNGQETAARVQTGNPA